jgi:hypothetical protein
LAIITKDFERDVSEIAEPLTKLTKKDIVFEWLEEQQKAFGGMVQVFTTAPIVRHFDHSR